MTPATVHYGRAEQAHPHRARVLDAAYAATPERFVRRAPTPPTGGGVDQQARQRGGRSLNSTANRLIRLDRLRPSDTPAGWSEPEVRTLSLAFRSIPSAERGDAHRLHYVSARLRVDRWIEHAEAHKFISSQRELYGHGRMQEIVVRALLHWRDALAEG